MLMVIGAETRLVLSSVIMDKMLMLVLIPRQVSPSSLIIRLLIQVGLAMLSLTALLQPMLLQR